MSEEYGPDFITITDEDGNDFELEMLDALEHKGQTYLAFCPAVEEGAEEDGDEYGLVILKSVEENGEEMLRYDLGEDFSIETAVVFGELYKNGNEWKFNAIGSGYQGGLAALCGNYGVDVE